MVGQCELGSSLFIHSCLGLKHSRLNLRCYELYLVIVMVMFTCVGIGSKSMYVSMICVIMYLVHLYPGIPLAHVFRRAMLLISSKSGLTQCPHMIKMWSDILKNWLDTKLIQYPQRTVVPNTHIVKKQWNAYERFCFCQTMPNVTGYPNRLSWHFTKCMFALHIHYGYTTGVGIMGHSVWIFFSLNRKKNRC